MADLEESSQQGELCIYYSVINLQETGDEGGRKW